MVLHIVHVVIDIHQTLIGNRQRTSRGILHTTVKHHLNHRVLNHLRIDVEVGHMLVGTQGTEDSISRRAHTTLQRQELLGDTALVHLVNEELSCQIANLLRHRVAVLEGTGFIGNITLYDTSNLLLGN